MPDICKVLYEPPSVLYRVFDKKEYALAFVETGNLRLKTLSHFANVKDELRVDATEGSFSIQTPSEIIKVGMNQSGEIISQHSESGVIHCRGEVVNPIYIYCFSNPPNGNLSFLSPKFGEYIVRVDDPVQFIQDITEHLSSIDFCLGSPVIEIVPVVYNKGFMSDQTLDNSAHFQLSYTQKPASFSDEYEYRLAVISTIQFCNEVGDEYDVNLGKTLPYATLISL
ncbi:MAG: hypothetical protein PHY16_01700 [Methylobacter sp.]|nr:hypothetical protein [Methylobacter sp.]